LAFGALYLELELESKAPVPQIEIFRRPTYFLKKGNKPVLHRKSHREPQRGNNGK
jgi:hypothetical protein